MAQTMIDLAEPIIVLLERMLFFCLVECSINVN